MSGILQKLECHSITVGGVEDHAHLICDLTKKHASMKVIEILKKESSKFVKTLDSTLPLFHWQDGYGAFSLSKSALHDVQSYIAGQEEHHRKVTFQEEFVMFLQRHGIEYDERYLWD